jgi:uncharacterized cupin superfamily protein
MKVDRATVPLEASGGGLETLLLSEAGGLTQFGAYVATLPPGARASQRHWHSLEDEFLLMLDGTATVVDDQGAHELGPGDAAAWRKGEPNAHHVVNRGETALRYLIVGSRVAEDICSYPDSGSRQINGATDWKVVDAGGKVLRGGALPPELLNLSADWGKPYDPATPAQRLLPAATRQWVTEADPAHALLGGGLGPYAHAVLGDPGGLTQFGVHLEELPPGSKSSFRHWHEQEDEMVYVLAGELVLVEEDETMLKAGEAACWPAGMAVGHCMENRSAKAARYLVIGTRKTADIIHYPDHDLITRKDGKARQYLHADGRPYRDTELKGLKR